MGNRKVGLTSDAKNRVPTLISFLRRDSKNAVHVVKKPVANLSTLFSRSIFLLLLLLTGLPLHAQDDATFFKDDRGVEYTVERVIAADYPIALAFAPDGRLFYTEKVTGNVRVISAEGELQREPVIHLPTSGLVERGMLGIALDPEYETNGMIWIIHIAEPTARDFAAWRLVRFHEQDGIGTDPEVMLSIPLENNALIHHGGNIRFDRQGRVYLSIGNMEEPANSQDINTLQGSILRYEVTEDGLVPPETNPFDDNPVFAYGLRNPWDFDIDPLTDRLVRIFGTENGDACDDEVNMILRGFHYGQGPGYECGGMAENADPIFYQAPLLSYTPTEAPTGIIVYNDEAVQRWVGEVFFCTWNTGKLRRITLNEGRNHVDAVYEMDLGDVPCRIDVAAGPGGAIYFTTIEADGEGAIYRLVPG